MASETSLQLRASPSASTRNHVHEHDQGEDNHHSDSDDGNRRCGDDHARILYPATCFEETLSGEPPRYRRRSRPSKLDPFREEIHRLVRDDPRLPGNGHTASANEGLRLNGGAETVSARADRIRRPRQSLLLPCAKAAFRPKARHRTALPQSGRAVPHSTLA